MLKGMAGWVTVFCNGKKLELDVMTKAAEKTLYFKDGSFMSVLFRTNVPRVGTVVQLVTSKTLRGVHLQNS